jgi:hypothetical protein
MTFLVRHIFAASILASIAAAGAVGEDSPPAGGARHALIVCGLSGDAAHRTLFGETIEKLYAGLTSYHAFAPDKITVLWSDPKSASDGPALSASRGPATRESLAAAAKAIAEAVQPSDALWVFVLGHAHYDGKQSWLNLPGPDMNHSEFGDLFGSVQCAEQVFFMTTAASGFFVKPLSKPGRIVIAATEADREVNETIFPHKLAAALAVSLLDAFLWAAHQTAQEYATEMLLATEHAQLDDNGDGRGREIQADFLPEELGGRLSAARKAPVIQSGDGAVARRLLLAYPPSPPSPEIANE